MVEKIPLPADAASLTGVDFEFPNEGLHPRIERKRGEHVEVIGHQQEKAAIPVAFVVIEFCAFQKSSCGFVLAKLILSAFSTAKRDEKQRP